MARPPRARRGPPIQRRRRLRAARLPPRPEGRQPGDPRRQPLALDTRRPGAIAALAGIAGHRTIRRGAHQARAPRPRRRRLPSRQIALLPRLTRHSRDTPDRAGELHGPHGRRDREAHAGAPARLRPGRVGRGDGHVTAAAASHRSRRPGASLCSVSAFEQVILRSR